MGRRSASLTPSASVADDIDRENGVIQVVARAFDILRCFDNHNARIGNMEIALRCGLPRSTVSRLTHSLTRMGLLAYLPQDQKYRLGPGAIAMSATILQGMQFRSLVRAKLQDVAEKIPGTVGFVFPDKFHMVYLEAARTYNAVSLNSTVGTRISIGRSAAGLAYASALPEAAGEQLLADMEQELPDEARHLGRGWPRDGNSCARTATSSAVACGTSISSAAPCPGGRSNTARFWLQRSASCR